MSDKQETPNCNMREALVSYLYNEATPEEGGRVEAHLADCAVCKQELHAFEKVRGMLQQWQLDDLPVVRLAARRSTLTVLKELLSITPFWAKAIGAVAMAVLALAVIGTDVRIGAGGFSFHADLLRRDRAERTERLVDGRSPSSTNAPTIEQVRADVKSLVNQLIGESERQQKDEIKAQLVSLESQLQNMHSADLAKLATRIQEQQARLKTIERDIDRREGLDLTDILFSEASKPGERSTIGGGE